MTSGVAILPDQDRYCFRVRSESRPSEFYRVDLIANGGYGFCPCVDFGTRRQPAIDQREPMGSRAVLCKHLIRARRYFLNEVLVELAKKEKS